jgi:hypothetical protein
MAVFTGKDEIQIEMVELPEGADNQQPRVSEKTKGIFNQLAF